MEGLLHPTMTELYTLVRHDLPYVVAAYAAIWLALAGYLVMLLLRMTKIEREIQVLQDTVDTKLSAAAKKRDKVTG
ncbi:MAG: CcmD family protein [Coriobacteriia bacterium]|nr:CcmD family protein [Coriobacteriia bacterium]